MVTSFLPILSGRALQPRSCACTGVNNKSLTSKVRVFENSSIIFERERGRERGKERGLERRKRKKRRGGKETENAPHLLVHIPNVHSGLVWVGAVLRNQQLSRGFPHSHHLLPPRLCVTEELEPRFGAGFRTQAR